MDIDSGKSVTDREDEGTLVLVQDVEGHQLYDEKAEPGTPVTIVIAGTYSNRYKQARLKQKDRNIQRVRVRLEAEKQEEQERQVCADSIITWSGFYVDGKPFDLNSKNAFLLLTLHPWIYDQCLIAQNDHASFSRAPSTS